MRISILTISAAVLCVALFAISCVETETKRTTKKVDAGELKVFEVDLSKPRVRVGLAGSAEQQTFLAGLVQVEIDDGEKRYSFGGDVYSMDIGDSAGAVYAPWVNTPDTGSISFTFRLVDQTGASMISDVIKMELSRDWYSQIVLGIFDHDACAGTMDMMLCREYTLPRAIAGTEGERFFLMWCGNSLSGAE